MKPTFLDYLTEVAIGDLTKLQRGDIPGAEVAGEPLPKEITAWLFNNGYYIVDRDKFEQGSDEYREAGEGSRASVFVQNDNDKFVLKISRRPDQCWLKFIKLARKSNNPHFPKVASLREWKLDRKMKPDKFSRTYEDTKGTYFFAMMERLWPLRLTEDFEEKHVPMLAAIGVKSWRGVDSWLHKTITLAAGRQMLPEEIKALGEKFLQSNHPFVQAIEAAENLGCDLDLHPWNVMMREPEGILVISDPVAER